MLNYTWLRFGFALVQLLLEPVRTKHSTAKAPTEAAALHLKSVSLEYSSHQRVLLPALRSFSILNVNKVLPHCFINLIVCESAPIPSVLHSIQRSSWVSSACCIACILYGAQGFLKQPSLRCLFQMFGVFLPLSSPIELLTGRRSLILLRITNVRNFFFFCICEGSVQKLTTFQN